MRVLPAKKPKQPTTPVMSIRVSDPIRKKPSLVGRLPDLSNVKNCLPLDLIETE